MRYFTKELWLGINDCDNNIRTKAEKEWEANDLTYQQQFIEAKKHLSQSFVKKFLARNGLHDYSINAIFFQKRRRGYSCVLHLSKGNEKLLLSMNGVKALHISIESFKCCIQGKLGWGYSEFELLADNNIKLAILCDVENEMQFEFESINLFRKWL